MDFDEAEMDMIRRGDMLGPTLGAKVATALETLQRERDEAAELNNKYAWERDKAREERDAAESRAEAFWRPQVEQLRAALTKGE